MTDRQMMTCTAVDSELLGYLEGTLAADARTAVDEHVASCLRCSSILRDIGSIRAQAAQLPELAPSRDLWAGISARIEPAVVPLGRARQDIRRSWIPAATAAAAALVIATAGITYFATTRSLRPMTQKVAAAPKGGPGAQGIAQPAIVPSTATAPPDTSVSSAVSASAAPTSVAAAPAGERSGGRAPSAGVRLASRRNEPAAGPGEIAYGDEIARLQNIIKQRRRELDPGTVTVIEQSLAIIDAAVRQSRAALARDPRSGFLIDQLNHALDKKIELLRTVALLPSRT